MKTHFVFGFLIFFLGFNLELQAQTRFDLEGGEHMIMYGKGPGQDATINPYDGQDCIALVKNFGENGFTVRIQKKEKVLRTIKIKAKKTKKIKLYKGEEFYVDIEVGQPTKFLVDYLPIKSK